MNLLDRRRMLLSLGDSAMIGDFSKYEKKTLTFPNAADASTWADGAIVPCGFEPKLIVFDIDDDTGAGKIIRGVLGFTALGVDVGGVRVKNPQGASTSYVFFVNSVASAGRYKYDNGNVYICRATSGVYWSPTNTYTFEIYG